MKRMNERTKREAWGARFMATVFAQAYTGNKDISYMDDGSSSAKVIPLDDPRVEALFQGLAAASAKKYGKP